MLVTVGLFNLIMAVSWLIAEFFSGKPFGVSTTCFNHQQEMVTLQNDPKPGTVLYGNVRTPGFITDFEQLQHPGLYRQCHQVAKPAEAKRTGRECRNDGMCTEDAWPSSACSAERRIIARIFKMFLNHLSVTRRDVGDNCQKPFCNIFV